MFSAVSWAADSADSCDAVSFDLNAPGLGVGDAAARKLDGPAPLLAAEAATTPTDTIAAATAEAITSVRPLLIAPIVGWEPQGSLGIRCEFFAR